MASAKKKAAKAQKAAVKARYNPYVQKVVEDEDLRQSIVQAYESSRDAISRLNNGKSPSKQIFDDKKLQKDIREAAENFRDAAVTLREAPKKQAQGRPRPAPAARHRRRRPWRSPSRRACARRSSTRCSEPRRSSSTPRPPPRRRRPRPRARRPSAEGIRLPGAHRCLEGRPRGALLVSAGRQPHADADEHQARRPSGTRTGSPRSTTPSTAATIGTLNIHDATTDASPRRSSVREQQLAARRAEQAGEQHGGGERDGHRRLRLRGRGERDQHRRAERVLGRDDAEHRLGRGGARDQRPGRPADRAAEQRRDGGGRGGGDLVRADHGDAREPEQHAGDPPPGQALAEQQVGADRDEHRLRVDDRRGRPRADRLQADELQPDEADDVGRRRAAAATRPAPAAHRPERGGQRERADRRAARRDPQRRRLARGAVRCAIERRWRQITAQRPRRGPRSWAARALLMARPLPHTRNSRCGKPHARTTGYLVVRRAVDVAEEHLGMNSKLRTALLIALVAVVAAGAPPRPAPARRPRSTVGNGFYGPADVTVKKNAKVRWNWDGGFELHDVTVKSGPAAVPLALAGERHLLRTSSPSQGSTSSTARSTRA